MSDLEFIERELIPPLASGGMNGPGRRGRYRIVSGQALIVILSKPALRPSKGRMYGNWELNKLIK
jgi:hypothetical protein